MTETTELTHDVNLYLGELTIETEGKFEVDADWIDGELDGAEAVLISVEINGMTLDRDRLIDLIRFVRPFPEDPVKALESEVLDEWLKTAEADRNDRLADEADGLGDYLHDLAQDAD